MTPQTSETSLVFPEVHGSARPPISSTKGDWRSVLIHPEAFERFKQIQKGQSGSPRFDLGDIVSAALDIVYAMPDAAALLQAQARTNFKQRL